MNIRASSLLAVLLWSPLLPIASARADDHEHIDESSQTEYFERAWEDLNGIGEGRTTKAYGSCSGVTPPDRPKFNKVVALTFDDGPNLSNTPRVVDVLHRQGVVATFFVNGANADTQAEKDLIREVDDDPQFKVGSHTWSHQNLTSISLSAARREIDRNSDLLASVDVFETMFRFPYGSANCSLVNEVESRQLGVVGWHIDSADWCFAPSGTCPSSKFKYVDDDVRSNMAEWVMRQVRAKQGGIILFHDIHRNTANQLESIIIKLKNEGYTFAFVDDPNAFPKLADVIVDSCSVHSTAPISQSNIAMFVFALLSLVVVRRRRRG
ncbi:MAG: polysaccharide deacetylase family protein [Polyangiales bacterium]